MPERPLVEIYSRPGCHLCDEAKAVVDNVAKRRPLEVRVVNIETDPRLEARYGHDIPVVFINGAEAFRHRVSESDLERKLIGTWKPSIS